MTAQTPLSPRAQEIVRAARELLESEGPDGLSMRLIAARLGVQAPSLYKHLTDKRAITNAIVIEALGELTATIAAAMDAADDRLWAGAMAQREWALAHPHLYRLIMEQPIGEEPELQAAGQRAGVPLRSVTGDDRMAFTALWCFGHGVIDQELRGRIPPDIDVIALWRRGLDALRPDAPAAG
ncbi:TetR/AcrR family transcriptional regulator [Patulibacter sp. SYSU D01012]|uniref:TetR/AcrR family transcriptional regulator n=1 Tax=Patulibacter sp. SYSU D01012 TaxID=2817381 RepID=UPI001B3046C5|nr:TetR/AcrR family transcriptional regulator [Patulibacter sp. SYSU D01012]